MLVGVRLSWPLKNSYSKYIVPAWTKIAIDLLKPQYLYLFHQMNFIDIKNNDIYPLNFILFSLESIKFSFKF